MAVTTSTKRARRRERADRDRVDYVRLAYALLESGDSARSVVTFLRTEYGLDVDQAGAAVILGQQQPEECEAIGPAR